MRCDRARPGVRHGPHGARAALAGLALAVLAALPGCGRPIDAYEGPPRPEAELATIRGGGFPNVRAIDGELVPDAPVAGRRSARVPAGPHRLVIAYQPCTNANSCGLEAATADVVLAPGRAYGVRHVAEGCTAWEALTSFLHRQPRPCRNYLWIADRASGEAIWGEEPPAGED